MSNRDNPKQPDKDVPSSSWDYEQSFDYAGNESPPEDDPKEFHEGEAPDQGEDYAFGEYHE